MSYALTTLWHERTRYLACVLAVAFSGLLIVLQWGLLLGLFSEVGTLIDQSEADVWVGYPGVPSVDIGPPIPGNWESRVANQPEVERVEKYLRGTVLWGKPGGGVELCHVIGTCMDDNALGAIRDLTPELRRSLREVGTIAVDESELNNLGLRKIGDGTEVCGCHVRLVGTVRGVRGITGAYVFCSIQTAHELMRLPTDQTTFLLARCRDNKDAAAVVARLQAYPNLTALTKEDFSLRSRLHWLTRTKAGIALGCAALLGLLVGAAVTSQMLYAATMASLRQYAVLEALGIPTWRMAALILTQSFWVGFLGVLVSVPTTVGLVWCAKCLGARIILPTWLLGLAIGLTMLMTLLAGLLALRSLRQIEPTALLR